MKHLLDNPSDTRFAAVETARTRYTIGTVAERHIGLFRRLVEKTMESGVRVHLQTPQ